MSFKYRAVLLSAFTCLGLLACDHQKTEPASQNAAALKLINAHFDLLNRHDLKGLVSQYTSHAEITSSDWDGILFGRTGADQLYHMAFYVSPDARYLVNRIINRDSIFVVEYDVIGLHQDPGSTVRHDVRNCSIFTVSHNLISGESIYSNGRLYHHQ